MRANFKHHVNVLFVVEKMLELADKGVFELAMYFDFVHEFLFSPVDRERGLLYEFAAPLHSVFNVSEEVARGTGPDA